MKYFLLALLLVCFASPKAQENKRYINVTGTSELILPADQMNFSVQIKTINNTIEESKKANDNNLNELMALLKSTGISPNDITTSPISLGRNYEYKDRESIQKGYYTEVSVAFLLKDLSKYYEITNRLSSSNDFANITSNYNISDYELQNKLTYQKALKSAKEKAEYMANTLGIKLGEILEIDANNPEQNYPNPFNSVTIIDSPNNLVSGKVSIKRSVRVKFALN
jgi:uncharacterized protein YggE